MRDGHTHQRIAAGLLIACGVTLVGVGLYFVVLRPPLLPEDVRYMGTSLADVERAVPGLANWLQKVFWVLGGYVASTGLFTVYLAATRYEPGAYQSRFWR